MTGDVYTLVEIEGGGTRGTFSPPPDWRAPFRTER